MMICSSCGVLFAENRVSQESHFYKNKTPVTYLDRIKNKLTHELFYNLIDDVYIKYLKSFSFKSAFDIGTRFGGFVTKLNENGIDAHGIEADNELLKFAKSKKVTHGYFDENYKPERKYDLICLTEMLYYLYDSISILNHAKTLLTDNGMIFISTLNPESPNMYNENSPLPNKSINVILSRKNFESLKGFELVDYTTFRTPLYSDIYIEKNPILKKLKIMKYVLKLAKPYVKDPTGEHAFVLLKKFS